MKILTLLIVSFILTVIWFSKGLLLGGGEAGVPFYNFQNELGIHSNAWVEKALGNPTGIVTALSPFFLLLFFLHKLGITPVFLQAGVFFILLSTGFIGMYLLVRKFSNNTSIAFLAALFYNLNLMAMTVVWNRFQYPFMFFYGFIPLALYLFIKGLSEKKIIYAFLLNFFALLFGMVFTSLPLLLLFWMVLGLYLLFFLITNFPNKKKIIWSLFYFASCIGIFFIFNLWWLLQFIQTFFSSSYLLEQAYATSDNYITFTALSDNLGNLQYLARLMHRDFFLWMKEVWGLIYFSPFFIILSFLPLLFIFGSAFIKAKPKEFYFFLFLALITVFFAKGSNDPFGGIFYFLFTHFKLLEAFRNPFEKIGLLIPLGYAPLFGFGMYHFYQFIKRKRKFLALPLSVLLIILICGVLVWPMWNGWVFTSNEPPANNVKIGDSVKVPSYYKDANDWLNQKPEDFRTIALPLKGEGLTHTWEYGYNGVDLSSSLFTKPFLAFCTGLEYLCSVTKKFQSQLTNDPENFWKVLPPLNASYVMVREDVDHRLRSLQDPKDIHLLLNTDKEHFTLEKQFDKLSFYKLNENVFQPKIDGAISAIYYSTPTNESFVDAVSYAKYQKGDIYFIDTNKNFDKKEAHSKQILLKAHQFIPAGVSVARENAEAALPFIRFLPDSPFYFYSRAKEKVTRFLAGNNFSREITIESDKRLVEAKRLIEKKSYDIAEKNRKEYQTYLDLFINNRSLMTDKLNQMDLIRQKYLLEEMIGLLKDTKQDSKKYESTLATLNELLYILGLETKYPVDLTKYTSYKTFIPEAGEYELIFETKDWDKFYSSKEIEIVIDGKEKILIAIDPTKDVVERQMVLSRGNHQIDILIPEAINLIDTDSSTKVIQTEADVKDYDFPFRHYDPFGIYKVSFDYFVKMGNLPVVFVTHDTDIFKKDKLQPFTSFTLEADSYSHDWTTFSGNVGSDPIAHTSKLVFQATPWNDCEHRNTGLLEVKCENKSFKNIYNKKTQIEIKNISVFRQINNNVFLRKDRRPAQPLTKPKVTYSKINSASYLITVDASSPFFFTFLESFHPSWRVYYLDAGVKREVNIKNHILINSFANAWYIDRTGKYQMFLEFLPQRFLSLGEKISLIAIFGSLAVIIILKLKEKYGK